MTSARLVKLRERYPRVDGRSEVQEPAKSLGQLVTASPKANSDEQLREK
jgi:hypothetical protein